MQIADSAAHKQHDRQGPPGWSIHPIREFRAFEEPWQRLNEQSGNSPLLEVAFVSPLVDHFARGGEVLAVHHGEDGIDAMGMFHRRLNGVWDTFQPAQAPLGLWIHRKEVTVDSLLRSLRGRLPGMVFSVGIERVDTEIHSRPADSSLIHTLDSIRTYRIPVQGRFDDYWLACSKNLQRNVRRQFNKIRRLGIAACMDVLTREDAIAAAIREFGRLESVGWKGAMGTAVHADNVQGRFYQAVLESFCSAGRGAIFRYRFDERVVAMDLCIERDGVLVNLKSAYDESVTALSPAMLLLHGYVKRAFEEARIKRIEFYGPEMDWNRQWGGESRTMYHVNHYRWPWLRGVMKYPAALRLRQMVGTRTA